MVSCVVIPDSRSKSRRVGHAIPDFVQRYTTSRSLRSTSEMKDHASTASVARTFSDAWWRLAGLTARNLLPWISYVVDTLGWFMALLSRSCMNSVSSADRLYCSAYSSMRRMRSVSTGS